MKKLLSENIVKGFTQYKDETNNSSCGIDKNNCQVSNLVKKQKRNEKGITMIALSITIIVLAMIAIPCIVGVTTVVEADVLANFRSDLNNLEESISQIYGKDADISKIGPEYVGDKTFLSYYQGEVSASGNATAETGKLVKNPNDDDKYYVINTSLLNYYLKQNLHIKLSALNYGNNHKVSAEMTTSNASDVYIINNQSRTIYYTSGIEYTSGTNGKTYKYYRLPEQYTGVTVSKVVWYTDKNGDKAPIPMGYSVSDKDNENVIREGLVIKNDENGNEFVFIPCTTSSTTSTDTISNETKFERTTWYVEYKDDSGSPETEATKDELTLTNATVSSAESENGLTLGVLSEIVNEIKREKLSVNKWGRILYWKIRSRKNK